MGDAYLEIRGKDLNECFQGAAIGLLNLIYNVKKVELKEEFEVTIEGYDLKNLLYKWLEFLLIKLTAERFAPGKIETNLDEAKLSLRSKVIGEIYSPKKHGFKREVKAITYHLMEINKDKGNCLIRYLVDL